ncbi:MAG: L-threonylcarbamoyladenylate synthase [Firmicutes bacterium]|nr:L-threonylcarbamoyladenylate synthase [Bacillota bacterium]
MNAKILKPSAQNIALCAEEIQKGGVVAFPTETVYGLGANVYDPLAIDRIFEVKGRPADNPLIVHVSSFWQIKNLTHSLPEKAVALAEKFMPGALTLVLNKAENVPDKVTAGLSTVAVRMPSNKIALQLIEKSGVPVAAPSANRSGTPSPTSAKHVFSDLKNKIPYILNGGQCRIGIESTVLDLSGEKPLILRTGAVSCEDIVGVIGAVGVAAGSSGAPASPGMKYRHYAPKAPLYFSAYYNAMQQSICAFYDDAQAQGKNPVILCLTTNQPLYGARQTIPMGDCFNAYAHKLYAALRSADAQKHQTIIAEGVPSEGVGAAIIDRLIKACGGNIL